MMRVKQLSEQKGFSLVEMMIAVCIMAIAFAGLATMEVAGTRILKFNPAVERGLWFRLPHRNIVAARPQRARMVMNFVVIALAEHIRP